MKEKISSLVDVLNTVKSNDSSSEIGATAVLLIGDKDTRKTSVQLLQSAFLEEHALPSRVPLLRGILTC